MENYALSQVGNPRTVVPARRTLKHLELNAKRKERSLKWEKDHQPRPTIHPICCSVMAIKTCDIIPAKHAIHHSPIFNSQLEAVHHPNKTCRLNIKHK